MKNTRRVMFQRSIQVGCIIGIGLTGLIGFLTLVGVESLHSIALAVTESLARTWRAACSMDVDDLLRQWFVGALGIVICAVVGCCVVAVSCCVMQLLANNGD